MKNKRKARVLALQSMYAYDIREHDDITTIFETIVNNAAIGKEVKFGHTDILIRKKP